MTPDRLPRPVTLVTGYFDVLRVEHVRELEEIRKRSGGHPVAVIVEAKACEILSLAARAELVAGLRVVDYVLTADHEDLNRLIDQCQPADVVRLETTDGAHTDQLIGDVQRSQTR